MPRHVPSRTVAEGALRANALYSSLHAENPTLFQKETS
jgi:hypothetical protein